MSDETYSATAAKGFMSKRVAGIPVSYIVLALAVAIAFYAYRAKSVKAPVTTTDATAGTTTNTDAFPTVSASTVIPESPANPFPAAGTGSNASITTNDEWLRQSVAYLISETNANPGDAQLALTSYLNGSDLTYDQGAMRDIAVKQFGIPPSPMNPGQTAGQTARSQGAIPRDHIVKSANDASASVLASVYYGSTDALYVTAIADANNGQVTYAVGQSVHIPAKPSPPAATVVPPATAVAPATVTPAPAPAKRTYTVVKGDNLSSIARRFGYSSYLAIYNANVRVIGSNPNIIHPGQVLTLP